MENSKFKVQKQVIENNELDEYFLRNFIQHFILRDMPTILRIGSFRFHFYSDEYNEPPHIHVATTEGECKFWLDPVKLARNQNLSPKVIRQIEKLVFENSLFLYAKYNEFHVR